ncbi:hypothetical protein BDW71DRAFT_87739 [Aspergillus fruticulosus]
MASSKLGIFVCASSLISGLRYYWGGIKSPQSLYIRSLAICKAYTAPRAEIQGARGLIPNHLDYDLTTTVCVLQLLASVSTISLSEIIERLRDPCFDYHYFADCIPPRGGSRQQTNILSCGSRQAS